MEYRFSLIDVQTGAVVVLEDDEPLGWDTSLFNIQRDEFYRGLMFTHTTDLEFVGDAYVMLKNAYDNYGIDYKIQLKIELQCDDNSEFEQVYLGNINYALFSDTTTDYCSCTVPVEEEGPQMLLKNREEIPIELTKLETLDGTPLTDFTYGPYDLNMHSRSLVQSSQLSGPNTTPASVNVADSEGGLTFPMNLLIEFTELPTIHQYSTFPSRVPVSSSSPDSLFTAGETGTYEISYNLQGLFSDFYDRSRSFTLSLAYRINGSGFPIYSWGNVGHGAGTTSAYAIDSNGVLSLNLNSGDTFSIYISLTSYISSTDATDPLYTLDLNSASFIKVTKTTTTPDTTAKAFAIHEALARVTQSIFNNTVDLSSIYYGRTNSEPRAYSKNGQASFMAITNGYALRGFPVSDRPTFVTFKDIFSSLDAIDCIAAGLEVKADGTYKLSIEPLERFFNGHIFLYFDNVFLVKRTVAEDRYYNELEIGYEKYGTEQGTDKANILDVFCSQHNYVVPQNQVKRKLLAKSLYVADQYSIEYTRRNRYTSTASEQWEFDEDNFLICLNRTTAGANVPSMLDTAEKDENFTSITNTNEPETGYNYRISPARNFLKWAKIVNACVYKTVGATIKFAQGLLNYKMQSQYSDDQTDKNYSDALLAENASIAWDDTNNALGNPIWSPEYYEFEYPLSWTQYKIIKENPKSCIAFSHSDSDFIKGFIISVEYNPVEGKAKFKVLKAFNQNNVTMGLPGELKFINCTNDELPNFFNASGLGVNEWEGWAIADGRNGTDDLRTMGLAQYDYSNTLGTEYHTLKSSFGAKEVTLAKANIPPHKHTFIIDDQINGGTGHVQGTGDGDSFGSQQTDDGSSDGLAGDAFDNRPPTYVCIIAQPIS